jgi:hypothetical protein
MIILRNGLLAGLVIILIDVLAGGASGEGSGGFLSWAVLVAGIVVTHRHLKGQTSDQTLSYGKALGSGTGIALLSGVVLGLYSFVIYTVNAEQIKVLLNQIAYTIEGMGIEGEEFDGLMSLYEQVLTPFTLAIFAVFGNVLIGFIFSLFISIFTSKSKTELDID